jgi:hypothetical protein
VVEGDMANKQASASALRGFPDRVPDLKPGRYEDGTPLNEIQFLECKLILKPERFTSPKSFCEYAKLVRRVAEATDVECTDKAATPRPKIREVLFLDTPDFHLYNNAFILRRRIKYEDGFPAGEPEIVFKFRHSEMQRAAEMDVRPRIAGNYVVKFKAEALPLKDEVGGYRLLFSHNVEFDLSQAPEADRTSMPTLTRVFPCLASVLKTNADRVELVSQTIVEEVLQDLGTLDFGKGMEAKFNVSIWRERGMHRPLAGEFAFQVKFKKQNELHDKALARAKSFFLALQQHGHDWLLLGLTKTGIVYHLKGNPPHAHE